MKLTRRLIYIIIITMVFNSSSCIKDDLIDCLYPTVFSFQHLVTDVPTQITEDKLADKITHLTLFLYTAEGDFLEKYERTLEQLQDGNKLILNLPIGDYTVVAWANVTDSYKYTNTEKFATAEFNLIRSENSEASYDLEDSFHTIKHNIKVSGLTEGIVKSDADSYDSLQTKSGTEEDSSTEEDSKINLGYEIHLLNFSKNTNNVVTMLTVIDSNDPSGNSDETLEVAKTINCYVTSSNGDYRFDNSSFGTDIITYIPDRTLVQNEITEKFILLKLWKNDGAKLVIDRPLPDGLSIKQIYDITDEIILQNPKLNIDVDRDYVLGITVDISDPVFKVTITVNGWKISVDDGWLTTWD